MRYVVAAPVVVFLVVFVAGRVAAYRRGLRADRGCCVVADPARDVRMRAAGPTLEG